MGWLRSRRLRGALALLLLTLFLLVADALCYQVTLPVEIDVQGNVATLHVGSETLSLGIIPTPIALQFAPHDPVVHEYQLDGTDSTNNFTLDPAYLNSIASSPYYRFQAWMRNLDSTSRWQNLQVWADGHALGGIAWPLNSSQVALPSALSLRLSIQLQRPETPMTLNLITTGGTILHITLDRNDRQIAVTRYVPGVGGNLPVTSAFFPVDPLPFAVMVIDSLIRIMLWAVMILFAVLVGEILIAVIGTIWLPSAGRVTPIPKGEIQSRTDVAPASSNAQLRTARSRPHAIVAWQYVRDCWRRLTKAIHPLALVALVASLCFVAWIALVQYNAEPHIYDASAYLFAAKMYATGHLSVPAPPAVDRFPGPFMVLFHGQWFAQYAPGTALTLVPGIWLGVPWLVEPILGTLALLGIGLIAARLYDRNVATLAVILGALSPFYSYLAASYLSHAVALFYFVWGLWALVRFAQGEVVLDHPANNLPEGTRQAGRLGTPGHPYRDTKARRKASWNLPLAAVFFGMAALTRDLVAVLFVVIVLPGVLVLSWRRLRWDWRRWLVPGIIFVFISLIFFGINLGYNAALTGSPWITPRSLFFAGDHWGFGPGVGFYGQHTLAAGFVNLDELLTILQIDLFGWPFYLTLALLAMPFLTRRAVGADWLMLAGATILTGAYVGYFYHGIYLGPRYLFETLPFLLILTSRGILTLATTALDTGRAASKWLAEKKRSTGDHLDGKAPQFRVSAVTVVLLVILVSCNLLYYMPRQLALHEDYTGLPASYNIDVSTIYHPPMHDAIVVTNDYMIYQFVLFPLNDPILHNDVIYAWAGYPSQYAELRAAFPGRALYRLDVATDGTVRYVRL